MTGSRKVYSFKSRWLTGWLPFFIVTAVIIRGAVMPPDKIPSVVFQFNDKWLHAAEFFVMMVIAYRAFERAAAEILYRYRWADAILYSLFLGALTECLQFYCPGRSPELLDFFADAAGVMVAGLVTALKSKSEIRTSKSETNPNDRNSNIKTF